MRSVFALEAKVHTLSQVGKSALVSQFLWEGFVSDYKPTVEEFNWIEYELGEGSALMLQVIDSSGSHDFLAMRHFYIRTGDAFLVVFSIDDASSFEEAKKIIEEIEQERNKKVPIVLVANKCDLYEDVMDWKARGSHQYAYTRSIPIVECSAKRQAEVALLLKVPSSVA
ncbi:Ras family protein [Ancylostoma caninum]|uniref:Ras family protein n=1 Tax=Ancylostoma caninum TaxID=29170 RepID=A0A368FQ60_ANCCA|nr:Ras family protein [Ancylostoma caninum]